GKDWELICNGFRNEYDAAFNRNGDLFTFDADMEWDMNTPWYRPTRVCMVASGAEFGWRSGAGKWPAYYPDSLPAVVDIGPGSPTGVTFGYGAKFPAKYQEALYICDWSYGKLYAVHLNPEGSAYRGEAEEFVTGSPLALTDLVISPRDGAMYFAVGGRKTQSALYRVTYTGSQSTAVAKADNTGAREREIRRKLESFHGHKDPKAIEEAWPYLGNKDRFLRFAARIALEHQDVGLWRDKALAETDPEASINVLIGLIRSSARDQFHRKPSDPPVDPALPGRVVASLDRIAWKKLNEPQQLELLRAYSLAFVRLGKPESELRERMIAKFDPVFPAKSRELNAELAQMLVYLEAPKAATKLITMLAKAPTQEEQMDYARDLRVLKTGWTMDQRREYFNWFVKAGGFRGGASLGGFLRDIKADAVSNLAETVRAELQPIIDLKPDKTLRFASLGERTVQREWTVEELDRLAAKKLKDRNFDRGREVFGSVGCFACHRFANEGGAIGPDLTGVSGRFSVRDLIESIVDPSKEVSDQYAAIVIERNDGTDVTGRIANLSDNNIMVNANMYDPNDMVRVNRKDIKSIHPSKVSMMPTGLLNVLKEDEILDLMAFLLSRGQRDNKMFTQR
ncbi:MAG TPA: heme-binding protein, partial [Candidatus Binatia bacterium]|nr:heme-binding protein [Candidatus Binatia bacterium]